MNSFLQHYQDLVNSAKTPAAKAKAQDALDLALIDHELSELRLLGGGGQFALKPKQHKDALEFLRNGMSHSQVVSYFEHK